MGVILYICFDLKRIKRYSIKIKFIHDTHKNLKDDSYKVNRSLIIFILLSFNPFHFITVHRITPTMPHYGTCCTALHWVISDVHCLTFPLVFSFYCFCQWSHLILYTLFPFSVWPHVSLCYLIYLSKFIILLIMLCW